MSERYNVPHHVREEARWEKENPEEAERCRAIAVDKALREARAASRRMRFLTADEEYPRVASVNESIETQR